MSIKNNARRKFLSDANKFVTTASYIYGLESIMGILFKETVAHASSSSYPFKYVNIQTPLGPPRWYFDQPLNPNNKTSEFIPGGFGTEYKKVGSTWTPQYKAYKQTFGGEQVYLPPVWNLKSSGGVAYNTLLNETVMIRGLDMEINSHDVNRERTIRPFAASPSISGLVGDASDAPSPSIGFTSSTTTNVFKSTGTGTGIAVDRANPIAGIKQPFNSKSVVKYDDLDHSVQQALRSIDSYASKNQLASHGMDKSLKNTYDIFARNLSAYESNYAGILLKYKSIITDELKLEFPGVKENAVINSQSADGSTAFNYDDGKRFNGVLLKDIINPIQIVNMADAFALAEFALTENLTSSVTVDLSAQSFTKVPDAGTITNDQHRIGAIPSIIYTSLYYRCMLACVVEFKAFLQSKNLYDKTLLHFTSEFSRTPRADMSGSDHGFNSSSTTLISGMIKKGGLTGNIYQKDKSDTKNAYPGTWGLNAPTKLADGITRHIINDDVVSTVCEMLQVQKIGTKGQSLVKTTNGNVELSIKEHKNVA